MKKLLAILCLVLVASCSQEPEILTGPFLIRDGIKYDQKTNKPIEGITQKFYENGQLMLKSNHKDGERQGLLEWYYENGQLESKSNYKDGELHGLFESYHENGQLKKKANYKDGELHGLAEYYDENGKEYNFSPK